MADFNWNNFEEVKIGNNSPPPPKFDWDAFDHAPGTDPKTSGVTAATTGLIQGAVPFASAIAGAGKAGMDAITGVRGPLAGGSLGDLVDDYREGRDSFANDAKSSGEAHPAISVASNIAGGVANPLFQFGAPAKPALAGRAAFAGMDTAAPVATNILPKLVGAGAVQALGNSDADLTKGEFKEAGIDSGAGALGGLAGYGVGKLFPAVTAGAKWAGKKALTNLGPSGEAIAARLQGKAQDAARSYPQLAEDLGAAHRKLSEDTGKLSDAAWETLSSEPSIKPEYAQNALDESIKGMKLKDGKTVGSASKSAVKTLESIKGDITGITEGGSLSEKDLKGLIQKLDENINWDDQSQNVTNDALETARRKLDEILKFQNPSYKTAMQPVAERTENLQKMRRLFSLQDVNGQGIQPTDATAGKIKSSLNENKAVTQDFLDKFKKFTGQDFEGAAKDYQLSQQFAEKGPQASSKKTNIGIGVGAAVGSLFGPLGATAGAGIGGIAGGTADAYGGRVAAKIIDGYLKAGNSAALGSFAPVLKAAAAKGPEALAVTSSILSKDPHFRQVLGTVGRKAIKKIPNRKISGEDDEE